MHVVREAGAAYYVAELGAGPAPVGPVALESPGESPGEWTGGGSCVLGLHHEVVPAEFADVFAGRDPIGRRTLRDGRGARSVAGVDLTFCAPKSVSLLHLLAPSELADAAVASHRAAVVDAVGYLERHVLGVRRSRGGTEYGLATTGAVAAGFVHRLSRSLDPHLHTHLVTANVAQGVDGLWSAVDTRRIFQHRAAIGAVYESSLRHELSGRAGVAWEAGPGGRWDIRGIDPVMLRLFSQRSASIDEELFRSGGQPSPGRRRAAFHADRPSKDPTRTVAGLQRDWRRRASDLGLSPSDLIDVVGRSGPGRGSVEVDRDALGVGIRRVAGSRATVRHRDLVTAVADASPSGARLADVERLATSLADRLPECRPRDGSGTVASVDHSADHSADHWADRRWGTADVVRALEGGVVELPSTPLLLDPRVRGHDRSSGPAVGREHSVADHRRSEPVRMRTAELGLSDGIP